MTMAVLMPRAKLSGNVQIDAPKHTVASPVWMGAVDHRC
jgi:hypothetical protein